MLDMIKEYYSNSIIDTFIIMSSYSDFYHITTFLRSCGKKVICYGETHTPPMLKNVCDEFVLCKIKKKNDNTQFNNIVEDLQTNSMEENLYQELRQIDLYSILKSDITNKNWSVYPYYKEYKNRVCILRDMFDTIKLISENKNLSALKNLLIRAYSSFSEKNYGFYNFKDFVISLMPDIVQTSWNNEKRIEVIMKINI